MYTNKNLNGCLRKKKKKKKKKNNKKQTKKKKQTNKQTKNIHTKEQKSDIPFYFVNVICEAVYALYHWLNLFSIFQITRMGSIIPEEIKSNLHYGAAREDAYCSEVK